MADPEAPASEREALAAVGQVLAAVTGAGFELQPIIDRTELGLGIGIAAGFATLGRIGFEGRYDYAAIGNSVILASRLSGAAAANQIRVSQRVFAVVEESVEADPVTDLQLKGFSHAMTAYAVARLREAAAG